LNIKLVSVAAALVTFALVPLLGSGSSAQAYDVVAGPSNALAKPAEAYVGGATCGACHEKEAALWRGSHHDLAMQVADPRSVLGNFGNVTFRYAGITTTFFRRAGKYFVNTDGPDGKLADFPIKYTFGVKPLQQYLIELPGGRLQAFGIAWDTRPKEAGGQRWFHLYPNRNLKAGNPQHWTGIDQNWNYQCADCHSTNLRKNFDAKQNRFNTTWSEIDVSCEACHGPGSNHVAWAKKEGIWKRYDDPEKGFSATLDERRDVTWKMDAATGNAARSTPRSGVREIETCARCHARRGQFTDDVVHGRPLADAFRLALLEDGLYWSDGQQRAEDYEIGSFLQSKMFARGVTCSDCHDAHSLKLRAAGSAVCSQCHLPAKYATRDHTHHRQGSNGAECVACHLPTATYMVVDPRRDHSIRVPRPDLSVKLGVPNACNNCHTDKEPQWAASALMRWYGKAPRGFQHFAEALAAGSSGAPGARGELVAVIRDQDQPAIVRASAIVRLARWLTPGAIDVMANSLNDPDPIVRAASVDALAHISPQERDLYLPRLLDDPVRLVRMDAARALVGVPEAGLPAAARGSFAQALGEYVAAQKFLADRPEGHTSLGNLYGERGDADQAVAEYRKAIGIDPTFVQAYANLADVYRSTGDEDKAEAVLRGGLKKNPRAAVLQHALGLSLARQKRTAASLDALREATRLAPEDSRFAYVYAVALNDSGHALAARKVLEAALREHPYDRDLLVALTYYSAAAGNRDAALGYVHRLRELEPEDRNLAQLEKQIQGPGHQ
jgi:Flp pilus assembly protein TadD